MGKFLAPIADSIEKTFLDEEQRKARAIEDSLAKQQQLYALNLQAAERQMEASRLQEEAARQNIIAVEQFGDSLVSDTQSTVAGSKITKIRRQMLADPSFMAEGQKQIAEVQEGERIRAGVADLSVDLNKGFKMNVLEGPKGLKTELDQWQRAVNRATAYNESLPKGEGLAEAYVPTKEFLAAKKKYDDAAAFLGRVETNPEFMRKGFDILKTAPGEGLSGTSYEEVYTKGLGLTLESGQEVPTWAKALIDKVAALADSNDLNLGLISDELKKANERGTQRNPMVVLPPRGSEMAFMPKAAWFRARGPATSRAVQLAGHRPPMGFG